MKQDNKSTILIVDDNPNNLGVLSDYLQKADFKVLIAESGKSAIRRLEYLKPDIILLDVVMSAGISGFETCRKLKNNLQVRDIPVIFMSALSDTLDKVKGFELGAVDYITKPFQQEEVLARIHTQLTISQLQKDLRTKNKQLIRLNQEKNEFLSMVAHDLKNPLSGVQGLVDFLKTYYDELSKEKMIEILGMVSLSSVQMSSMVKKFLDINAIESGKMNILLEAIDLLPIIQSLVIYYNNQANAKNITVQIQCQKKPYIAFVDDNMIRQVLDNLISNAIKYSPHGKSIFIQLIQHDNHIRFEIRDEGPGLSKADQKKLFGKLTRLTARPTGKESSTGLGLFITKKLVDAMNSKVWCETELGQGAAFMVEFPVAD